MSNTLLDHLMMISSNEDEKAISDLCGEVIQLFQAHLRRFPNRSSVNAQGHGVLQLGCVSQCIVVELCVVCGL